MATELAEATATIEAMAVGEYLDLLAHEVYGIERRESINGPHPETDEELRGRLEIGDDRISDACYGFDLKHSHLRTDPYSDLSQRATTGRERLIQGASDIE
jgi:hypothetical protein